MVEGREAVYGAPPMSTKWNDAPRDGWGMNTGELLNVILVYEDRASAQRGLAMYQRLMNDLGVEYEFNLNVWKFAVLGLARLDEVSREQAAAADLVIVCTRDESAPPERVQAWFERWLELKGRDDCALVMLREAAPDSAAPAPAGGFFDDLAPRGGIACFPPAATRAFGARVAGRAGLPRRCDAPVAGGWFPADRRNASCA